LAQAFGSRVWPAVWTDLPNSRPTSFSTMACDAKTAASMLCAFFICPLYVMMLCGSQGDAAGTFGGAAVKVPAHGLILEQKFKFGWLGLHSTFDGNVVESNPFHKGKASWLSYNEKEWGLPWKKCSKACPASFFFALLGLLLAIVAFSMGATRIQSDESNPALQLMISTLCTLCGVLVLLVFGLGCYNTISDENVGFKAGEVLGLTMEKSIGGGYIVAIIATGLSMVMMAVDLVNWKTYKNPDNDHETF